MFKWLLRFLPKRLVVPSEPSTIKVHGEAVEGRPRKRVVVIHTGGTIFMHKTARGLDTGSLAIPSDVKGDVTNHIDFDVIDLFGNGGIDSSKMTMAHCKALAEKIVELQNDKTVDGIVVTHGTDTMAETAIELSYALKNVQKPVVLTGSQTPSEEKHSDGPRNFYRSIFLAAHAPALRKVVICFGYRKPQQPTGSTPPNLIIDARNAEKSSMTKQDAFLHPESKELGSVSVVDGVSTRENMPVPAGKTYLHFKFSSFADRRVVERHATRLPIFATGLVAELYGFGNVRENIVRRLARRARFFLVVAASQVKGKVNMLEYVAGRPALEAGVLPSGGLSPLSASKRLAYLVAHRREIRHCARQFKLAYRQLLSTLYLSGAEFDSEAIKTAHARVLGVPIVSEDLLVQIPFDRAVNRAAREIKRSMHITMKPIPSAILDAEAAREALLAEKVARGREAARIAREAPTEDMIVKRVRRAAKAREREKSK